LLLHALAAFGLGSLENPQPNSVQSGIGLVSGWVCQASVVTVQFDGSAPQVAAYGTDRADTASVCGGRITTGVGLLFNFNNLGPGTHTAVLRADGAEVGRATFTVVTFGAEFLTGATGSFALNNFPTTGKRTLISWEQARQNFAIAGTDTSTLPIAGNYYGSFYFRQSGCGFGPDGTYIDNLRIVASLNGNQFGATVYTEEGLTCQYAGATARNMDGTLNVAAGTLDCGSYTGPWTSPRIVAGQYGLSTSIAQRLDVGGSCTQTGNLGVARQP
jgi:hypothetical protein